MRDTVARQKAAIARDTEKVLRAQDRQRLRDMRAGIVDLRRSISRQKILDRKARREALQAIRRKLRQVRPNERAHRRNIAREVSTALRDFRAWWQAVLVERANRQADLKQLRAHAKAYRAGTRERIREGVAAVQRAAEEHLAEMASSAEARRERMAAALRAAERDYRTERADQSQFRRTKRNIKARAPRVTRKERASEFTGGVEANLLTPEEHAVWRSSKRGILLEAKRLGIKAPDAIAELVRERTEADPDLAIELLARHAERDWAAEYRKAS
jgi:hypothetical protein